MELEKEIKTKAFSSEAEKALLNIVYTGNWLTEKFTTVLKPYAIHDQHYNVLRILRGRYPGSACPGEVKEILVNKRGDLTRIIDKLVKQGFVYRESDQEKRRNINLFITEKGLDLLTSIAEDMVYYYELVASMSEKDAGILNKTLDDLRD